MNNKKLLQRVKFLSKVLADVTAGIAVAFIVSLAISNFEPAFVYIEATSEKGNLMKIYEDLQTPLSYRGMQGGSSFDTTDGRIRFVIFVYDDLTLKSCEEVLLTMMQKKNYAKIDYCIVY